MSKTLRVINALTHELHDQIMCAQNSKVKALLILANW